MRDRIARWAGHQEYIEVREIFGSTAFLHLGNFLAAEDAGGLVVRLSGTDEAEARQRDGVKPWRAGVPMASVYTWIPADLLGSDEELHAWLDKALAYTTTLEPKERLITKQVRRPAWMDGE